MQYFIQYRAEKEIFYLVLEKYIMYMLLAHFESIFHLI